MFKRFYIWFHVLPVELRSVMIANFRLTPSSVVTLNLVEVLKVTCFIFTVPFVFAYNGLDHLGCSISEF
jgi:hypothetical protein